MRLIYQYSKLERTPITEFLNPLEMHCKCSREDCHYTLINIALVKSFMNLRRDFGAPITITSGYRCQGHNASIKGSVKNSRHTIGSAMDIKLDPTGELIKLAEKHFDFIKVYDTFIHCDVRNR